MPIIESRLEQKTCQLIERSLPGVVCRKDGRTGYPDRFVLLGHGLHLWIEFKAERGRLTPAQKRVIPRLLAWGETVIFAKGLDPAAVLSQVAPCTWIHYLPGRPS